jgi:S1-C subfamily serine protease
MQKFMIRFIGAALIAAALPFHATASDFAEKGREIFKKHSGAVVTVQTVIKSKVSVQGGPNQSNEARQDISGTVIDPSGLVVLSLTATDPSIMLQSMMENETRFKMETELSDLKILLEDGTEIAAEVVLRDKDLDLAFVRPKTKLSKPMAALDLANSGKAQVLDELVSLNRLGNAGGRAYAASAERVSAIMQRPRLLYVPETSLSTTSLGCPAFTMDGKVLGFFVMRTVRSSRGGGMSGLSNDMVTSVIVPAEAVLKAAKQVPPEGEAAPAEKKESDGAAAGDAK